MAIEKRFTGFEFGEGCDWGSVNQALATLWVLTTDARAHSGQRWLYMKPTSGSGNWIQFYSGSVTGTTGTVSAGQHKRVSLRVYFRLDSATWNAGLGGQGYLLQFGDGAAGTSPCAVTIGHQDSGGFVTTGRDIGLRMFAQGHSSTSPSPYPWMGVTLGFDTWYRLELTLDLIANATVSATVTIYDSTGTLVGTVSNTQAIANDTLPALAFGQNFATGAFNIQAAVGYDDLFVAATSGADAVTGPPSLPDTSVTIVGCAGTGAGVNDFETGVIGNILEVPASTVDEISSVKPAGAQVAVLHQSASAINAGVIYGLRVRTLMRDGGGGGNVDVTVNGVTKTITLSAVNAFANNTQGNALGYEDWATSALMSVSAFNADTWKITKQNSTHNTGIAGVSGEAIIGTAEASFTPDDDLQGDSVPLVWSEFALIVGGFSQTYRWAKVDLADPASYYGGFKEARILSVGAIRRALSDKRGNYEAASWGMTVSDTDRLLRGVLAGVESRYMLNKFATLRMISDEGRRALRVPRTVAIGLLRDYQPINPLQFSLTFEDYLALFTGLGSQEKQIPKRKITVTDFTDCPTENRNKPVPVVYGDFSSGNSTSGAPVITGDPARGYFTDEGYKTDGFGNLVSNVVATSVVTVTQGAPGSGTMSNDVPNGTWGAMVTGVDALGRESDPVPFYSDQPGGGGRGSFPASFPQVALSDGTRKVTVAWTAMTNAVKYRVYLGWYYYGFRANQAIETAALSADFTAAPAWLTPGNPSNTTPAATYPIFGQGWSYRWAALMPDGITALSDLATNSVPTHRRPLRTQILPITGALEYYVYRYPRLPGASADRKWTVSAAQLDANGIPYFDDDLLDTGATIISGVETDTGNVPVTYVGTRVDNGGFTWFAFLICGHAIKEVTGVFQNGVKVDPGNYGVTFAVPGQAGFGSYFTDSGSGCQYRDINGHRYTLLYVRGPQGDAAKDGSQPITVNVKGIETVGDGSGTLITDAFDVQLHAYRNFIFGDYQTGSWPTSGPTWPNSGPPAVEVIDDISFGDAKLVCQQRIAGGYTAAVILGADGEFLQARDWIQRFNLSCASWTGFNRKSQWFVRVMDDSAAPVNAALSFTDVRDVFGAPDIHDSPDDLENVVVYSYTRKWALKTWGGDSVEVSDGTSIANSGQTRKSQTIEMWLVRNATMAADVAQRRLLLTKEPPRTVVFTVGLQGMSVELGDIVKLTTAQGIGATGWNDRPIFITRHELNPDKLTVRLEGIDVDRIYAATFILGDEGVLPAAWTGATTAQQKYGYLADETTKQFSDGKPGKRLR